LRDALKLEVAQNPISLTLSDPNFFEPIAQSYRGFLSGGEPKLVIQIHFSDETPHKVPPDGSLVSDGRGFKIYFTYFSGSVDFARGVGNLYTTPEWLILSLQAFLRNVFTFLLLLDGDGLALHALGVLKEGEVYVFFGPSGSGKTTAATLSEGNTILSDDLVFLQPEDGSYWVHPTPPWGDMQRGERENRPYPIKAAFKLIKSERIEVSRCNPVQAISDVITLPPMPADLIPPDRLLARFSQLVEGVPFYELRFVQDRSFWPCIDGNLREIGIKNAKRGSGNEKQDTH
jgi:hypothetical protein